MIRNDKSHNPARAGLNPLLLLRNNLVNSMGIKKASSI
jgi:hypothetical protein